MSDGAATTARIHEQGYRRYRGSRRAPNHAVWALTVHTLRFILGHRRRFRSKVLPIGIAVVAALPALGFVAALLALPAFAQDVAAEVLPGPQIYLGGTILLTYLGAAVAGPAALCSDRSHGVLALYLASPLTRDRYLLAKAAAVIIYLSSITILPSLIYVLGSALSSASTLGAGEVAVDALQVIAAGSVMAVAYGLLGMAAASLADRQGAASALVIGVATISAIVIGVIVNGFGLPEVIGTLDINRAFVSVALHIHGAGDPETLSVPAAIVGTLGWTGGMAAMIRWRYHSLQVTR